MYHSQHQIAIKEFILYHINTWWVLSPVLWTKPFHSNFRSHFHSQKVVISWGSFNFLAAKWSTELCTTICQWNHTLIVITNHNHNAQFRDFTGESPPTQSPKPSIYLLRHLEDDYRILFSTATTHNKHKQHKLCVVCWRDGSFGMWVVLLVETFSITIPRLLKCFKNYSSESNKLAQICHE